MTGNTARVWEISAADTIVELHLQDHSGLDAVTGQLSDGFYTTFRTYANGTKVVGLAAHLVRLYNPSAKHFPQPACSEPELRRVLNHIMEEYRPQETRIRVSIDSESGRLYFMIQPLKLPSPEVYQQGVYLVTTTAKRQTPTLKTTAFISDSQAERAALAGTSAYEGLIIHNRQILEGLTSNFFYVWAGELGTAGRGVLPGVTRGEILHIARKSLSIPVRFRALRLDQVPSIQEAFICSSSREIVPVVRVNEERIGSGGVGFMTRTLMGAFKKSVIQRAETFI